MKKILLILLFLVLSVVAVYYFKPIFISDDLLVKEKYIPKVENVKSNVSFYNIFGNHFNMEGNFEYEFVFEDVKEVSLVLKNLKREIKYPLIFKKDENNMISFKSSEKLNEGINLEKIDIESYFVLLKVEINNSELNEVKYYSFENKSEYGNLDYYTITRNSKNKYITINFDEFLKLDVVEKVLPNNVYDITLDPGHGGMDTGALSLNKQYTERDIVLEVSYMLKEKLEELGLKVKVTRPSVDNIKGVYDTYGNNGRAVIPNIVRSKLFFSIHANSDRYETVRGGVEIYTIDKTNLSFAQMLSDNIVKYANTNYSAKVNSKVQNGVYIRNFSNYDILDTNNKLVSIGRKPYENLTTDTPYYFMLRETGGVVTKAYVDGRNPSYYKNPFYNSNSVVEPFLIELGYVNNKKDLNNLRFNKKGYVEGLFYSIKEFYNL